jgi:quinol monooxygenase YgiN
LNAVVELRQYKLHPGRRDELIELFEREFVHTQEAVGITVLGRYRDLDDPDRFVWLRSFPDMPARKAALEAFYGGPVWREFRDRANATMIDSDDVLLLTPMTAAPAVLSEVFVYPALAAVPAVWRTLDEPNTFPALPIRSDDVVVTCTDAGPGWLQRIRLGA